LEKRVFDVLSNGGERELLAISLRRKSSKVWKRQQDDLLCLEREPHKSKEKGPSSRAYRGSGRRGRSFVAKTSTLSI